jgi:curved DNA-binding protein CbpA
MRGGDLSLTLEVDLLDAARGAKRAMVLPDGRKIEAVIPAGVEDGHVLRLAGMGGAGLGGGPRGDAYVEVRLKTHPVFERKTAGTSTSSSRSPWPRPCWAPRSPCRPWAGR